MTNVEKMLNVFRSKPYTIEMGKGKLSKRYNVLPEDVETARMLFRREGTPINSEKRIVNNVTSKSPKILVLDIETAPMAGYIWSRWKQNISLDQTIHEWFILSWAAKWLTETSAYGEVLTSEEAIQQDDKRIVSKLWDLLDEADIVIGHNSSKYDIKKINSRFLIHGMLPPSPYQQIDTLKVARKEFNFSSNKLDALAGYLGLQGKIDTNMELWIQCLKGNSEALKRMLIYNINDVRVTEQVYYKLRGWITNHPNLAIYDDTPTIVCRNCGSHDYVEENKYVHSNKGIYKILRCTECGAIIKENKNELTKDKRKFV